MVEQATAATSRWRRPQTPQAEVTLQRKRIYILPTRHGVLFALVLFAMLLGAINYNNSLAFSLTFLLASLYLVSILHTYRNLHRLTLRSGRTRAVFASDVARFQVGVSSGPGPERLAIQLTVSGQAPLTFDLPGNDDEWLELPVCAAKRGWLNLPELCIESRYPLSLFRAWSWLALDGRCLVYPHPADSAPELPLSGGEGRSGSDGIGADDFVALRPYRAGDSLRHVHWKAEARDQGMQVKLFGGERSEQLWLEWERLQGLNQEQRLSLLTRWVLDADKANLQYGLILPSERIPPGNGEPHLHRCLKALALFGVNDG